jgi:2-polyprenyl-3-methyl-5-hydroxy-6-metoxy-1,4-benzoquinol methylase
MSDDRLDESTRSWQSNAAAWTRAVREGRIESRRLVTDSAIVRATTACAPRRVLDAGCGEGWLCRALADQGIEAVGIDASADLIAAARERGRASYHDLSYGELARTPRQLGQFDAVVCNFALLEEDIGCLLAALRLVLEPAGLLLIQTVHPWTARGDSPYQDGWRVETFDQLAPGFGRSMPWFYRTLESWVGLLTGAGWRIEKLIEPCRPGAGSPASLLVVASSAVADAGGADLQRGTAAEPSSP